MGISVRPNCKYGHGDLTLVAFEGIPRWSLIAEIGSGLTFSGRLYLCAECGYTEFFDDEPARTIRELKNDERS